MHWIAATAVASLFAQVDILNPGFEAGLDLAAPPERWSLSIGGQPDSEVSIDIEVAHSGDRSVRLSSRTPSTPYVWTGLVSEPFLIEPDRCYTLTAWARTRAASHCYVAVSFEGAGDRRMHVASGDSEWREYTALITTPPEATSARVAIVCEGVTDALWVDDVSLTHSPRPLTQLVAPDEPRPFEGVFPRGPEGLPETLITFDATRVTHEERILVTALQGLVSRTQAGLYIIQPTNPPRQDELWLAYLLGKGYAHRTEEVATTEALLQRYEDAFRGAVIYDPALPGTIHVAAMIAGLDGLLPATAELAANLGLTVVEDLRGRWERNIDGYRWVYDTRYGEMCHHVLAWLHPALAPIELDYRLQHNVFTLWRSSYADSLPGADPAAEELFVNEVLAAAPANIPVLGWPSLGDGEGISEYECVSLLSEYAKVLPGLGCSNLSVHSAIRPPEDALRSRPAPPKRTVPEADKVYVILSVLESGDALWYWQMRQRQVWEDPRRGEVPINWSINITLPEVMPLIAQWYMEQATDNDVFFGAVSGVGYMLLPMYARRYRAEERQRIIEEYVALTDAYCRRMGLRGIEFHTDGTPPEELRAMLTPFVAGMTELDFVLNDFTRFTPITPQNASYLIGGTAVFHTLTRFKPWATSAEVAGRGREEEISHLLDEIRANTPAERPAFLSAMATSWTFDPSWIAELSERLPDEYEVVRVDELAAMFRAAAMQ